MHLIGGKLIHPCATPAIALASCLNCWHPRKQALTYLLTRYRPLPPCNVGTVACHTKQYPSAVRGPVQVLHPPIHARCGPCGSCDRIEHIQLKITGSVTIGQEGNQPTVRRILRQPICI